MKKLIAILSAIILVLAFTACDDDDVVAPNKKPANNLPPIEQNQNDNLPPAEQNKNENLPPVEHEKDSLPEQNQGNNGQTPENQQVAITDPREKALILALDRAGVTRENAYDIDIEKDFDFGVEYWEIDFKSGGYEYDVKIKAEDMTIVRFDKERDN